MPQTQHSLNVGSYRTNLPIDASGFWVDAAENEISLWYDTADKTNTESVPIMVIQNGIDPVLDKATRLGSTRTPYFGQCTVYVLDKF